MATVREFITQAYRLINPSNPTVPLHGNDLSLGITVLNQLLQSYAATGLMLTISKTETTALVAGQEEVVCGPSTATPTPDITRGRLANMQSAWLTLDGTDYPLIDESRNQFLGSWKYGPLEGLPRFIILFADNDVVRLRLYPKPSQAYQFYVRGKFELSELTSNDTMDVLPQYYHLYAMYATARQLAKFKGRNAAWTPDLEDEYQNMKDIMISTSEVNLEIGGDKQSLLNGANILRAGIGGW